MEPITWAPLATNGRVLGSRGIRTFLLDMVQRRRSSAARSQSDGRQAMEAAMSILSVFLL